MSTTTQPSLRTILQSKTRSMKTAEKARYIYDHSGYRGIIEAADGHIYYAVPSLSHPGHYHKLTPDATGTYRCRSCHASARGVRCWAMALLEIEQAEQGLAPLPAPRPASWRPDPPLGEILRAPKHVITRPGHAIDPVGSPSVRAAA